MDKKFEICNVDSKETLFDYYKFVYLTGYDIRDVTVTFCLLINGLILTAIICIIDEFIGRHLGDFFMKPYIFFGLLLLCSYYNLKLISNKRFENLEKSNGLSNTVTFYDDGMCVQTNQFKKKYSYSHRFRFYETSKYFYIFIKAYKAQSIDKSKFTLGNPQELRDFLENEIGVNVRQR